MVNFQTGSMERLPGSEGFVGTTWTGEGKQELAADYKEYDPRQPPADGLLKRPTATSGHDPDSFSGQPRAAVQTANGAARSNKKAQGAQGGQRGQKAQKARQTQETRKAPSGQPLNARSGPAPSAETSATQAAAEKASKTEKKAAVAKGHEAGKAAPKDLTPMDILRHGVQAIGSANRQNRHLVTGDYSELRSALGPKMVLALEDLIMELHDGGEAALIDTLIKTWNDEIRPALETNKVHDIPQALKSGRSGFAAALDKYQAALDVVAAKENADARRAQAEEVARAAAAAQGPSLMDRVGGSLRQPLGWVYNAAASAGNTLSSYWSGAPVAAAEVVPRPASVKPPTTHQLTLMRQARDTALFTYYDAIAVKHPEPEARATGPQAVLQPPALPGQGDAQAGADDVVHAGQRAGEVDGQPAGAASVPAWSRPELNFVRPRGLQASLQGMRQHGSLANAQELSGATRGMTPREMTALPDDAREALMTELSLHVQDCTTRHERLHYLDVSTFLKFAGSRASRASRAFAAEVVNNFTGTGTGTDIRRADLDEFAALICNGQAFEFPRHLRALRLPQATRPAKAGEPVCTKPQRLEPGRLFSGRATTSQRG